MATVMSHSRSVNRARVPSLQRLALDRPLAAQRPGAVEREELRGPARAGIRPDVDAPPLRIDRDALGRPGAGHGREQADVSALTRAGARAGAQDDRRADQIG